MYIDVALAPSAAKSDFLKLFFDFLRKSRIRHVPEDNEALHSGPAEARRRDVSCEGFITPSAATAVAGESLGSVPCGEARATVSGRVRPPGLWVSKRQGHAHAVVGARGQALNRHRMTRAIASTPTRFPLAGMNRARSGPLTGALGRQLSALERRHRLRTQQERLQAGPADPRAMPPYPARPRPPS